MMRIKFRTVLIIGVFLVGLVAFLQVVQRDSKQVEFSDPSMPEKAGLNAGSVADRDIEEMSETNAVVTATQRERPKTSLARGSNSRLILEPATDMERTSTEGKVFDQMVFLVRPHAPKGPLTMDEHTLSAIEADLDLQALEAFLASDADSLRLPITEDREVVVKVEKVIARGMHTHTLIGKVVGDSFSDVFLTVHDGAVSGSIAFLDTNTHYQYAMAGNGDVAIRHLDTDSYNAECGDPGGAPDQPDSTTEEACDPAAEPPAGYVAVDTVVGYGQKAREAQGGTAAIEALIINAVDRMNTAFSNSLVNSRFISLLAMIEDPDYVYPGDVNGSMASDDELGSLETHGDGKLDVVSQLRIDLGADQNSFVIKDGDGGAAGIAYRPGRSMIVARTYMTSTRLTFAHEFGHNLACNHSWGDTYPVDSGTDHYRYGWRLDPPDSVRVRTIMAYDWSWGDGARIVHYSNPDVSYNGAKTGAVQGYDATGDMTADQRYVSNGYVGYAGSGFDGTHPQLGANNASVITYNAANVLAIKATRTSLAVLDPAAGILWQSGQTNSIFWYGGDQTDTVEIALYKGGVFQYTIASGIAAHDRWHPWTVPFSLPSGTDYQIRVTLNGTSFDDSDLFSIGVPPQVSIDTPAGASAALPSFRNPLELAATTTVEGDWTPSFAWTKVSGPGTATFTDASAEDTTVTFSATGSYRLRLTATADGLPGSADVTVLVVELNPSGTIIPYLDDLEAVETFSNVPASTTVTGGNVSNGLTLAVSYTPSSADIATSIDGGDGDPDPVVLLEIGGTTSGSGLYIVDGGYWFVSAVDASASTAVPTLDNRPAEDLNGVSEDLLGGGFAGRGLSVRLGDAVAGTAAEIWASLDSANGMIYGSVNGSESIFNLTGIDASWNWIGDGSIGFLQKNGQPGGLAVNGGAGPWRQARAVAATGPAASPVGGQYFNSVAEIFTPGTIIPYLDDRNALTTFSNVAASATASGSNVSNGLTLAVNYTPSTSDIATSVDGGDGDPDPVVLLEIGSCTNGAGLYIVDSGYWFATSVDSAASTAVPTLDNGPAEDLNGVSEDLLGGGFAGRGVSVRLGDSVADTVAKVWVYLDSENGTIYGSVNGSETTFDLTGIDASWNWEGDGSIGFLQKNGQPGGLAINGGAGPWRQARAVAASGTAGDPVGGQFFNEVVVFPPLFQIGSVAIETPPSGNEVVISWQGLYGLSYTVQTNDDLLPDGWGSAITNIAGVYGPQSATGTIFGATGFYRVILED